MRSVRFGAQLPLPQTGVHFVRYTASTPLVNSDEVLARRLVDGDAGAMEEIRERYGLTIYAMAYGELLDSGRASVLVEDVLAECGSELMRGGLNGGSLSSWMSITTRRLLTSSSASPSSRRWFR